MLRCMQQAYVESCLTRLGFAFLAGWLAVGALVLCLARAAQDYCWIRWKVEASDGGELRRLAG